MAQPDEGAAGGVRAARVSASYGARVAVAEEYRVGGTCVIRGCVPKKLLVYASRFRDEIAKLEVDVVAQAATVAKAFKGRPVQLIWSREEDTTHDMYRPAALASLSAGLDGAGNIVWWQSRSASGSMMHSMTERLGFKPMGPDKTNAEDRLRKGRAHAGKVDRLTARHPAHAGRVAPRAHPRRPATGGARRWLRRARRCRHPSMRPS